MYIMNTVPHGKCHVRNLRTRCIRNLIRTLHLSFYLGYVFLPPPYWKREDPGQQLVRKYRTFALSMKYSMQLRISSFYVNIWDILCSSRKYQYLSPPPRRTTEIQRGGGVQKEAISEGLGGGLSSLFSRGSE